MQSFLHLFRDNRAKDLAYLHVILNNVKVFF